MDLIPDEELKSKGMMNLTPMVDFLFLVVAIFATLAITRTALFDSELALSQVKESPKHAEELCQTVNLSVNQDGVYKWITEFNEYRMDSPDAILQELNKQIEVGILPQEHSNVKILLHIDRQAQWDPIVQLVHVLKKTGYSVHPVYAGGGE